MGTGRRTIGTGDTSMSIRFFSSEISFQPSHGKMPLDFMNSCTFGIDLIAGVASPSEMSYAYGLPVGTGGGGIGLGAARYSIGLAFSSPSGMIALLVALLPRLCLAGRWEDSNSFSIIAGSVCFDTNDAASDEAAESNNASRASAP